MKKWICFYFFLSHSIFAQNSTDWQRAELYYSKGDMVNAAYYYQQCVNEGNEGAVIKLVFSLAKLGEYEQALRFCKNAKPKHTSDIKFAALYADLLIKNGEYLLARKILKSAKSSDEMISLRLMQIDTALKWKAVSKPSFILKSVNINTDYEEVSPFLINNELYFSSNKEEVFIRKKSLASNLPEFSLYKANKITETKFSKPQQALFEGKCITQFSFFSDSAKIYYSQLLTDSNRNEKIDFFSAKLEAKKLINIHDFVFSSEKIKKAFPHITHDEKMFFFSANLPNGFGGMDIYVCLNIDNSWTEPINLGASINSSYDEISPFYNWEGNLFFASNKPEGMGGYDVYFSEQKDGEWQKAINLKFPLNSNADEWNLFQCPKSENGYLVSTRNKQRADIFYFEKTLFLGDK